MKKETTTANPQVVEGSHTKEEWKIDKYFHKIFCEKEGSSTTICAMAEIIGEREANAQRIVKGVNALSKIEKEIAILEKHRENKQISSNGIILLAIYVQPFMGLCSLFRGMPQLLRGNVVEEVGKRRMGTGEDYGKKDVR